MKSKSLLVVFLIFLVSFLLYAEGSGEDGNSDKVLVFGHYGAPHDTVTLAAEEFKKAVEERSQGRITIELYPGNQLGDAPTMLQGIRGGTIDIVIVGNPYFTSFNPEMNLTDLPFLFQSYEHAYQVLDGEIGQTLFNSLESFNLKGLAFWEIGFRNVTNNIRQIHEAKDLKGIKLRTTPNPAHVKAFEILGAIPTPMPFAELYMALKTKTVDGQENPVDHIYANNLHEVQTFLSLTQHAYTTAPMVMNLDKFNKFSPEDQNLIITAAIEAAQYQRNKNREIEDEALQEMIDFGMKVEKNPKIDTFREAVEGPVTEMYVQEHGSQLLDQIKMMAD